MTTWQIEPLGPWNRAETSPRASSGRFRASWQDTLDKLLYEIDLLDPTDTIVVRVDCERGDLRRDGMLRAKARGGFPGVVVSFTSAKHGPLTYATDAYEPRWSGDLPGWQANLRAIALSLEALRAVDRYGVTRSGEQYVGWRQIEATPAAPFSDADSAARWVRRRVDAADTVNLRAVVREAQRQMHPDASGERVEWDLLERATELMRAGGLL